MNSGEILYKNTSKDGREYIIRYPLLTDAAEMTRYINILSDERTFITFQGEHLSEEQESDFLTTQLQLIQEEKAVLLFVVMDDKIAGIGGVERHDKVMNHEGVLSISLASDVRGQGIGSIFFQTLISEAERSMPELKIITLGVFADNDRAIHMYKKFGFTESGRVPKGVYYKDKYVDHLYMYKFVNEFTQ